MKVTVEIPIVELDGQSMTGASIGKKPALSFETSQSHIVIRFKDHVIAVDAREFRNVFTAIR